MAVELHQARQHAEQGKWDQVVALYREATKKDRFNEKVKAQLENGKARALVARCVGKDLREFKLA
jgi:hypothetical protein